MNLHRRHLSPSQRAAVALDLLPMLELEARQRQLARLKRGDKSPVGPNLDERGRSDAKLSAIMGVSRGYIAEAKALKEQHPALYREVRAGRKSLGEARAALTEASKDALARQIAKEPSPIPTGPFRVLVIDPPWPWEGLRPDDRGRCPYPDMTLDAIRALPVGDLAHEDCIVWLWAPNSFLHQAFHILDHWGFEDKGVLTWVKNSLGLGRWLRGQTEQCLLGVRGEPKLARLRSQGTALFAPKHGHSRKPDEFYSMVESLCPGSKLEMFSRQSRAGWQSWGAEQGLFDTVKNQKTRRAMKWGLRPLNRRAHAGRGLLA
jgi:N6-adenosine-specific RNA methylase IME4